MPIDEEGRITAAEFDSFILVTVYTPNSQSSDSERHVFRTCTWDPLFAEYISDLEKIKPVVICGDLNVAHSGHRYLPSGTKCGTSRRDSLDSERENFQILLNSGFQDAFRLFDQPARELHLLGPEGNPN